MTTSNIPKELSRVIESRPDLKNIVQLHTCTHSADASSAIQEGAVLLAVAPMANDVEGDGMRCLIGLPNGVEVTSHLSCFFSR